MTDPRPQYAHEEKRTWSHLPLLVPASASSCAGHYWRFDWDPTYSERKYVGKKWKLIAQPVKEIPRIPEEQSISAANLPSLWHKHYKHFTNLVKALKGDPKLIEGVVPPSADLDYRKTVTRNPLSYLSARFDEAVTFVKFVMWQKKDAETLTPGLLLVSEEMIPFALAAYNSIDERGHRFCERKSCGKEFVPTYSAINREQRFCGYRCRRAVQEQRRRDKKKRSST